MKQQVLVINGGNTFPSYEKYIYFLKNREIDLEKLKPHVDWKNSLQGELGESFEVYVPKMPNVTNAQYEEWKIWFERILCKLEDNIILVGHSLGGIFLVKYLSENKPARKIEATIIIAAPFDDEDSEDKVADFKLRLPIGGFVKQGGKIYFMLSKDDPYVSIAQLEKYEKAVPNAKTMVFEGKGHFQMESFPELVELIKSI